MRPDAASDDWSRGRKTAKKQPCPEEYPLSGTGPEALAAGFDGFIPKPFEPYQFVFELQRFVKPSLSEDLTPAVPFSQPAQAAVRPRAQPRKATILVVDDRPENLDLSRSMLESGGFGVETAGGVQEALLCARKYRPSLILTDVHMGDGTGFDLAKTIRTDPELRKIPCVLTSATYLEVDPRAAELGLDESTFILRPIDPETLLSKIEACLIATWRSASLEPDAEGEPSMVTRGISLDR